MSKKKELDAAANVIEKLLGAGKSPLAQDFQRYRLKNEWEKIVGHTIASKSSPLAYTNWRLYIWVVNSAWMNQLFYARKEIIKKINSEMGDGWVRDIRLTLDTKDIVDKKELKS
jgi:predicted nucleic acid-binding Zn ribbon protein